jgi:hypothetical protein
MLFVGELAEKEFRLGVIRRRHIFSSSTSVVSSTVILGVLNQ